MHWLAEHGKDSKHESQSFKPAFSQWREERSGLVLPGIVANGQGRKNGEASTA
jgi:hypothetical protein